MGSDHNKAFRSKIHSLLGSIYDSGTAQSLTDEIVSRVSNLNAQTEQQEKWSEQDTILITYGDSIKDSQKQPLESLETFLNDQLKDIISCVHILPFFPYSSDDGFSVIDFNMVDPALGDWENIQSIGNTFELMFDLVLNHMSSQSEWFHKFLKNDPEFKDFFIQLDKDNFDTANVVRPRASSPFVPVKVGDQDSYVWATFSHDQIDLNFDNPRVLLKVIDIILFYFENKAKFIRLDAVGFLFKRSGTSCIHLPETHAAIKLIREISEAANQQSVIITETNVPNKENLSYFGNGNEAHMIYNFSLPPLILHALIKGTSRSLKTWMMSMPPSLPGCCYLNFTASHDGIGLRPLEGLIPAEEVTELIDIMKRHGGAISYRATADGKEVPYEINVSLYDAYKGNDKSEDQLQRERFLCSQVIMMGLEGIPAFYIHSLLSTGNDYEGMKERGHNRAINRHRWDYSFLNQDLAGDTERARIFSDLKDLIKKRKQQPAFHPNATQFTIQLGDQIFAFWRQSLDRKQSIFCIHNVTASNVSFNIADINLVITDDWFDIISQKDITDSVTEMELAPYECLWISNYRAS